MLELSFFDQDAPKDDQVIADFEDRYSEDVLNLCCEWDLKWFDADYPGQF